MKKLVELLLCIIHPLAVVLMWINLYRVGTWEQAASSRGPSSG